MGFISRRVLPVCGNMCVCCPALRSRSRQPVKRYKKLLAEIFPKSVDGPPNERKIVKLCEYAARNPFRIPKIAKYLEQRIYKELRSEHIKIVNIITEAFNKLLCMCKEQMAYFALNILNVIIELLDHTKKDAVCILGCQTLTRFIYNQADGTYTHNIEGLVHKVCSVAHDSGEEQSKQCLRASSLQCLSAMVWFMGEFSHIFADFDEIVHLALDNYDPDMYLEGDSERGEPHHNWVDEVVRCEARVGSDLNSSHTMIRARPEKKDLSLLTREEIETPKIWAQICIQKMVELAKESTTMRRILDPMFYYFDTKRNWVPHQGLSMVVMSDMCYFAENSGSEQLILASAIRHLDHKKIAHDPRVKSYIIQIAAALARQFRRRAIVAEIGIVSDLCRHLRKSLQAKAELVGQEEANLNISLQNSIEECLLEIAKGIGDAQPLFDIMGIALEKLPSVGVVARATIGSLLILTHIISLAFAPLQSQQMHFSSQLLKTMVHPDTEVRVGAHQIFASLLVPTFNHPRHELASLQCVYMYESKRWQSKTASALASATALLEKLRREKGVTRSEKHRNNTQEDSRDRETSEEEWKHGWARKNSPNFYKLNCYRTSGSACSPETEPNIVKLSEDQTAQLLSAFWIQANLPDNLPSNFEALAHSFCLTLISSRLKNPNHSIAVRFFQLPLSLRNISLDPHNGMLPPSCQRSLFTLATAMLMFAAKIYHISDLNDLLKSSISNVVDPFLSIGNDSQLYIRPQADMRECGSASDCQVAMATLSELREVSCESDRIILDILVGSLSNVTEMDTHDLAKQLSEAFTPDDALMFAPHSALCLRYFQMIGLRKESHSDGGLPTNSSEDDVTSDSSNGFPVKPKVPASPSLSHIISVGQLLESALEVAGQVVGATVSTSPLPYSAMASQCEALGTGTRKKLSNWLAYEASAVKASDKMPSTFSADGQSTIRKITNESGPVQGVLSTEQWLSMRLPPASPFDNFLKAAGC
uniref:Protein EFR3 homolog B n=1 Tax=Nelumbo nucifera TaxID=4432 RepID=A0A822Z0H7_NELNU|nr:TPA_asm: hypothetical protein HUJ06_008908 [Nelumbo nucifera]